MTDKQFAVKVDHVSKYFKLPTEATNSLRTAMVNRFKGIKGYKEQHVLKDISFEVEKGDFFGILGRNGSGKSTLLKIISEIIFKRVDFPEPFLPRIPKKSPFSTSKEISLRTCCSL